MARALVGGMITNGKTASSIYLSDISKEQLIAFENDYGVNITQDNHALIQACEIVVLAVKPQVMQEVVSEVSTSLKKCKPLLLSIAAGITIDSLQTWIGETLAVIRCMPNTPALINLGASALYANTKCEAKDKQKRSKYS